MLLTRVTKPTAKRERSIAEVLALLDGGVTISESGEPVTTDTALQQSTVWACVRILSESIAQLPAYLQRRQGNRWLDVEDHAALELLARPNDWQTPHEFMGGLVIWNELRGNAYCYKAANSRGRIIQLVPMPADDVSVRQGDDWRITYKANGMGTLNPAEVFHLRNFSKDGYQGLSTIGYAREAIGLAISQERHGSAVFRNATNVGKVMQHPAQIGDERYAQIKRRLDDYNGARNAGKTLILDGGAELKTIGMTLEDAQFIQSRRMQKQEIAAVFGIPLFLLNDTEKSTTWGSGLEQLSKAFVRYTLNPRLSRISQTLVRELLTVPERRNHRFVFDTDAFTLGDFKERMDGYRSGIEAGVINPNEAREMEGRNPRDGGEEYRQPINIGTEGQTNEM